MLIKLIYKILKKLIDNCDKFYLEETDPDVIEAKELLGRVEKAMKAKGDDANAQRLDAISGRDQMAEKPPTEEASRRFRMPVCYEFLGYLAKKKKVQGKD